MDQIKFLFLFFCPDEPVGTNVVLNLHFSFFIVNPDTPVSEAPTIVCLPKSVGRLRGRTGSLVDPRLE